MLIKGINPFADKTNPDKTGLGTTLLVGDVSNDHNDILTSIHRFLLTLNFWLSIAIKTHTISTKKFRFYQRQISKSCITSTIFLSWQKIYFYLQLEMYGI